MTPHNRPYESNDSLSRKPDHISGLKKFQQPNSKNNMRALFLFQALDEELNHARDEIAQSYKLLHIIEVNWTRVQAEKNLRRLLAKSHLTRKHLRHNRFHILIFKTPYSDQSNCEHLPLVSSQTGSDLEPIINRLSSEMSAEIYLTDSHDEFNYITALLLSPAGFQEVLLSTELAITRISEDLHGEKGWTNFEDFIEMANLSASWVVLRNFEFLPDNFFGNDKDVDILCNDVDLFVTAMNMSKRSWGISAYETTISNQKVAFDIRFVGDGYYDRVWQREILKTSVRHKRIVPRPNDTNYFYSLLYHACIHKHRLKSAYVKTLTELSETTGLAPLTTENLSDAKIRISLIRDFFDRNGYKIEDCADTNVKINTDFLDLIGEDYQSDAPVGRYKPAAYYFTLVHNLAPRSLTSVIPAPLKRTIKKIFEI